MRGCRRRRHPGDQGPRDQRHHHGGARRLRRRHGGGRQSRAAPRGRPPAWRRADRSRAGARLGHRHRRRGARSRGLGRRVRARRRRTPRPQGVSQPLPQPRLPPIRHHRQHDHQGVVEEAARRPPHRQAFDHGDRGSPAARRPRGRRLGRRLPERRAGHLRRARGHPCHGRRQWPVLCQRQPAAGDRRRLCARIPRRRATSR